MPRFSKKSLLLLDTCSSPLKEIAFEAIKVVDFSVVSGHRGKAEQNILAEEGKSTFKWPSSKHNELPSRAFDLLPYPSGWTDWDKFFFLAGVVMNIAFQKKVRVRWGGAWDGSFNGPEEWNDLAHFELLD